MNSHRTPMVVSRWWAQIAILTFLAGFTVLGLMAYKVHEERPPIPANVLDESGQVIFTGQDILAGQHVFRKYGLMQHGTIFGHGAYLGPDFTAEYLHKAAQAMLAFYTGSQAGEISPAVRQRVQEEMKRNTWNAQTDTVTYSPGQVHAWRTMTEYYAAWFGPTGQQEGLRRPSIVDPQEVRALTSYFSWAAWACSTLRPGMDYSYTNNWPQEPLAANNPTGQAVMWSALSLVALLCGTGVVFFLFGRYSWLGWHGDRKVALSEPGDVTLTASQRMTAWYFLVVAGLFLAQGLLGGANAHYHAQAQGVFGRIAADWLPYNLTRTWHVQLALFFIVASYLAMGIFIAPMIARREPKGQGTLALIMFVALVAVVIASLLGEAASIRGYLGGRGLWFWIGNQGWEYLDLGRLWQILLVAGMALWLVIVVRGIWPALRGEHPGNMPYLFLYSSLSIPAFYAVGMAIGRDMNFAVADFWRFWVVHLWVEDFLELFTTIMVAYLFVLLGVVPVVVATMVVYLDIILYSVGGVIGTMHHAYFSGAPAIQMSLGAFFSAMEVIPLVLLTYEAYRFMQIGTPAEERTMLGTSSREFPHKWAVMFLIAVGFWNFLGAGVFGFLINLPIVSYYEIGTQFTANHGHAALMGVYGMLAMGFFMFVAQYFVPRDRATDWAMRVSFWSLNVGLAAMVFVNLVPVGFLQFQDSLQNGYWHARAADFYAKPWVNSLEWARLPGDLLFIMGGIGPVVYLALRMFLYRNRKPAAQAGEHAGRFVDVPST
ncbi:MAG: nitric-oxide reductase large subunit [Solirubrobacterales bacterium]